MEIIRNYAKQRIRANELFTRIIHRTFLRELQELANLMKWKKEIRGSSAGVSCESLARRAPLILLTFRDFVKNKAKA